ncbi:chemotaxis protein CheW [Melittangium boletus]|uniref:chemotaxis protein CheW n=1 Tax=Melittangium boletus TaxID=83453 RepID=UPI003DA4CE3C
MAPETDPAPDAVADEARDEAPDALADAALLERRAARYARPGTPGLEAVAEYVAFARGAGQYALPLVSLREARPLRHLARVPGASPVVAGVFQFRGEPLSAHDLAAWMTPEGTPGARAEWVLVVEHAGARLGLLADSLAGIERLRVADCHPVPLTLGARGECFRGVLGGQRLLLEPERLFSLPAFFRAF